MINDIMYSKIIEEKLGVVDYFQDENDIRLFDALEKINNAANAMKGKLGDMTGINICIQVASSFVMLGSSVTEYQETTDDIKKDFEGVDPTVIITIAALYYILKKIENTLNKPKIEELENRFVKYVKEKILAKGNQFIEEKENKIRDEFQHASDQLSYIYKRLGLMNWMIGEPYMEKLGIIK